MRTADNQPVLLDLEYGEDLVDSILSGDGDEDGNSDINGVDDGDRDDASTSDNGDNAEDAW